VWRRNGPETKDGQVVSDTVCESEYWLCVPSSRVISQERSHTVEAQLAETTTQLHELKLKQRQLEARNHLLEKVAALHKQPSSQDSLTSPKQPQRRILNECKV